MSRIYLEWQRSETMQMHGTVYASDASFDHGFGTRRESQLEVFDFSVWAWVPEFCDWYMLNLNEKQLEIRKEEFLEWAASINKESA